MPERNTAVLGILGGLAKLGIIKAGAAVGTKSALMHTAIATEGAVSTATTVGGAAGAVGSGGAWLMESQRRARRRSAKLGAKLETSTTYYFARACLSLVETELLVVLQAETRLRCHM